MNFRFKVNNIKFVCLILLIVFMRVLANAQQQEVIEPPIPIYIVCPYHADSLKAAFESYSSINSDAVTHLIKKCDSLEAKINHMQISDISFIGLLILFSLLTILSILTLASTKQIRKSFLILNNSMQQIETKLIQSNTASHISRENIPEPDLKPEQEIAKRIIRTKKPR